MKRTTLVIALWAMVVAGATAQKTGSEQQLAKEANSYFEADQFLKAYPLYSQLVSLYPQNPDYSYRFGACAIYSDPDKSKAIQYLASATKREVQDPMAWYYLGKAYHLNYQFRDAVKAYETFVTRADQKTAAKYNAQREIETCIYGSSLLSNIKDVVVISKTEADRENFFRYMNLDGIGGKILTLPEELKTSYDKKMKSQGVIHYPGNSTTIYFSSYGKDGSTGKDIYRANLLPDGKFSTPEKLKGDVNSKYDEDYCFMQSDGKTLYFASRGHNSMGGYDIFKSVYDPQTDSFGPAVNLDFAINTPDDDIFFIADTLNQRAYFASGRASDQEHLHVYNVKVEGIPLHIIYLKGEFISEIDAEQKNARIQVKEGAGGRSVMNGESDGRNGNYVLYVPKGGSYTMQVKPQGSAMTHEVTVDIPSFDRPVALRQEMRLVKVNGQEKLIVQNYFETPLEEDLSALAAVMLREKANLEVNATENDLEENAPVVENITVEKVLSNAPLAAGFAEGVTAGSILSGMENEAAAIEQFVRESDQKYMNAYAYAAKKQAEADAALKEAERIRSSSGNSTSAEDVQKARESQALVSQAEAMQRDARAAVNSAEAVKQYRETEAARAAEIREQAAAIRTAEKSGDFDATVAAMSREKQRQVKLREGNATPQAELNTKARSQESALKTTEAAITDLREKEKQLVSQLKGAEAEMNNASKKSDKEAAATRYTTIKGELDATRRSIVLKTTEAEEQGGRAADAVATAAFFERLSNDTQLGLTAEERTALTDIQRSTLAVQLDAMDSRIESLSITDPGMLALIKEGGESQAAEARVSATERTAAAPVLPVRDPATLKSRKENTLARLSGNDPALAPARRMVTASTLDQTNARIVQLEQKRLTGINTEEKAELEELKAMRSNLQSELAAQPATVGQVSADQVRATYEDVHPGYAQESQSITASNTSELDQAVRMTSLKKETLADLRMERVRNADAAMEESDVNQIVARARRDQELEAAIRTLETETNDLNVFKAAYELENKSLVENNDTPAARLDDQITLTENYIATLGTLESEQQEILAVTDDQEASVAVRMRIGEIRKETELASARLAGYRQDRSLTTAASAPATAEVRNTAVDSTAYKNTLEDVLESEEDDRQQGAEKLSAKMTEAAIAEKVTKDAEAIKALFKQKAEEESIFAYETGELDALIKKRQSPEMEVRNREKIAEIQAEIFLVEAEIENEKNPNKQRKLDREAERLYLKKSLIEIGNAQSIQKMTTAEYTELKDEVASRRAEESERIESRNMLRDEMNKLTRQAETEFEEATALRQKAENVVDDIEKNDYYRQAFAKELLAIELLRQSGAIMDNLDMLTEYDDQELAELRYGNPSKVSTALTAEANGKTAGTASVEPSAVTSAPAAETAVAVETTPETAEYVDGVRVDRRSVRAEGSNEAIVVVTTPVSVPAPAATPAAPVSPAARAEAGAYSESEAANYYYAFPDVLTKDLFTYTNRAVYSESRPIPVDAAMPQGVYYKVQVGAFRNNIPQNLYDEFAPVSGETISNGITRYTAGFFMNYTNAEEAKLSIRRLGYSDAFVVAFRDGKRIPLYEAMGLTEGDYQAAVEREYINGDAGEAPSRRAAATNAAPAGPSASGTGKVKRTDYYKGVKNAAPVTMVETTSGLFFTVQVGVYSKPTPAASMKNITPLNSELTATNKIRYTSGIYTNLQDAVNQRSAARGMGISDAFITAYYNGERITLSEADRLLKEYGPSILIQK